MDYTEIASLETFGERLKAVRALAGVSQAALAKSIGVEISTISRWERDFYVPDLASLTSLTREFQIHLPEITSDVFLGIS